MFEEKTNRIDSNIYFIYDDLEIGYSLSQ